LVLGGLSLGAVLVSYDLFSLIYLSLESLKKQMNTLMFYFIFFGVCKP